MALYMQEKIIKKGKDLHFTWDPIPQSTQYASIYKHLYQSQNSQPMRTVPVIAVNTCALTVNEVKLAHGYGHDYWAMPNSPIELQLRMGTLNSAIKDTTLIDKTQPFAMIYRSDVPRNPASINAVRNGNSVTVSWGASPRPDEGYAPIVGYKLERSFDGGGWAQIYDGPNLSFTDTRTTWKTAQYRVRAYDGYPDHSGYTTSATVTFNQPPTVPASITVPDRIVGGQSNTISWGASTDPDGNLSGYRLEHNVNGGGWGQIYQGPNRSHAYNVTYGWNTVGYRVKAFDAEGAESGYATGPTRTVFNNVAPTVPPSINVPDKLWAGDKVTVTWGGSTDANGNLSGYKLERNPNNAGWSQVFQGNALTFTDTLGGNWTSVVYRVRAFDAMNAHSDYRTSPARTVIVNTPPVISGADGGLGLKSGDFSQAYTVTDAQGGVVTVREELNGALIRSYNPVLGQSNQITVGGQRFQILENKQHALKITATDERNASSVRNWTFTKSVTELSSTWTTPKEAAEMPTVGIVNANYLLAPGAELVIEVCNNGFDPEPAWQDITSSVIGNRKFHFTNKDKTADRWGFNLKATINRNGAQGTCCLYNLGGNFE